MSGRLPGRPTGNERFGREKIVNGFRMMACEGSHDTISRKDLATYLGITPALITYYFPEKNSLLREAMEGSFTSWRDQMMGLLSEGFTNERERLSAAISLLFAFFATERHAENLYTELVAQKVIHGTVRGDMERALVLIVRRACGDAGYPVELVARLIWGACRHAAEAEIEREPASTLLLNLVSASGALLARG